MVVYVKTCACHRFDRISAMQQKSQQKGIQIMLAWLDYQGLYTGLGASANFVKPEH